MNRLWRYILGEIKKPKFPSPPDGKELGGKTQESYDAKLLQWLKVTDSLRGVTRSTCTLVPMSHVSNLEFCFDIWAKFELLYRDTGFMERDAIPIRLSSKTSSDLVSDFDDIAQFVHNLKRDSTRLEEIGTTDVPSWMFTTWLLHGLSSEYDSFRMMLNNNRKDSEQSKKTKDEPDFDSILEQILNLDTRKTSEARSVKSALKPKQKKKSTTEFFDLCPYCSKPDHHEDKCYYKHPEGASEDFRQRLENHIKELQSKANAVRGQAENKDNTEDGESNTSGSRGYVAQQKDVALAAGQHDTNWYFDIAVSYHMT